jgi:putative oxidoreductase
MKAFDSYFGRLADLGPLLLRIGVGLVFVFHGAQKLFDIGVSNYAAFIDGLGVPFVDVVAPVQSVVELAGGALLILGLFTRFTVLPLIAIQIGAILLVRTDIGFLTPGTNPPGAGAEFDTALLAGELCLLFVGPVRYALDAMLGWESIEQIAATGRRQAPPVPA